MREKLTQATEDYLKAIYEITDEQDRASTNEIAEWMGVAPASATGMIQRLAAAEPPLVNYHKHRGVSLTAEGKKIALELIRHHRLLETFLQEKLGYTWDEVHEEADQLEHVISEELEERIALALGDPTVDPHGEPIPSREFQMPDQSNITLSELRPGDQATVERINDTDPDLLRYLGTIGMIPNRLVTILDYSAFDGNLRLRIAGQNEPITLGPRVTSQIYMRME